MAAPDEVTIKTNIVPDKKGAEDASRSVKKVGNEAEKAGKAAKSGFDQARGAVARFNSAVRAITNISFIAGGIASVVQLWDRLTASAKKAKEEAVAFAAEQAKAADAKRIDELAKAYTELGKAISSAAKDRQRANELEDLETSEADRLEDEEAKLEKARQIARTRRDAETKERREYAEAEAKHGAATDKEFSLIGDRTELDRLRRKANEARAKSGQENEFDVKTFGESFVNNLKSILSLDGEHFWSDRTARGDEERKRQAEEAKRYDAEAKALEERIKAKEAEIAEITAEASHHSKRAGVFGMSAANTAVAAETAGVAGATSTAAAERAVAEKEASIASARAAAPELQRQAEELRGRIAAEQARKDAANYAGFQAQGTYDAATLGGDRRAAQGAGTALLAAQEEARNVGHEADKAINALTETLKSIEARLKAAQNFLKNQSKQQNYAWTEAPAG